MKNFKALTILMALMLVLSMAFTSLAQDEEEGVELTISGLIAFVDGDIVITVDADDDGEVSDEEFADGQEVVIAPGGSFNPSDYEDGDEITLTGILLESGTFQATGVVEGADEDGDGFISSEDGGEDCDDTDETVNPDAEEVADGIDNDCDGNIDEVDADEDGFDEFEDCDDLDASINPDAEEIDDDGIDSNCDGEDNNPVEEEESNCRETHPVAEALAEEFGLSVSEVMALHCAGVGFGNIARELSDGESLGTIMGNAPTAEEREAIQAEREAEREARADARAEARAEREASRADNGNGNGGGGNDNGNGNGGGGNGNGGGGNGNGNGGGGNGNGNGNGN